MARSARRCLCGNALLVFARRCPHSLDPPSRSTPVAPSSTTSSSAATRRRLLVAGPARTTRRCSSPTQGWTSSRTSSPAARSATYRRATSSQKCVRAGGKHNDLENVGPHRAPPHLLRDAGELLLRRLLQGRRHRLRLGAADQGYGIDPTRLVVTSSRAKTASADDEARALWKKVAGCRDDRIIGLGVKDNFWAMGDTGPCGPCSEIHYPPGPTIRPVSAATTARGRPATATAGSRSGTWSSCSSSRSRRRRR